MCHGPYLDEGVFDDFAVSFLKTIQHFHKVSRSRQTINAIEKGGLQPRHPPVHRHLPGAGADPE